ncbi:hypothetical protein VTK56DRAFT_4356 [Thermocarpiscus australiensis]
MASPPWSLTAHLLSSQQPLYKAATQHPFLLAGAEGRLPKDVLSRWLANDRLYIHSYIRAAGRLLASLDLPQHVSGSQEEEQAFETQLADWLIEALVAIRREERFFIDVAGRYGLGIEIAIPPAPQDSSAATPSASQNGSDNSKKLPGLPMMQSIFSSVAGNPPPLLPWLEGALTFWGTERCYLDAWSWARDKALEHGGAAGQSDADGGALRREFIPNWSSADFARFVDRLGRLIDSAVAGVLEGKGEADVERVKGEILARVEGKWRTLLEAEKAFWPDV